MEATVHLLDLADAVGAGEPSPEPSCNTGPAHRRSRSDRGGRGARRPGGPGRRRARDPLTSQRIDSDQTE